MARTSFFRSSGNSWPLCPCQRAFPCTRIMRRTLYTHQQAAHVASPAERPVARDGPATGSPCLDPHRAPQARSHTHTHTLRRSSTRRTSYLSSGTLWTQRPLCAARSPHAPDPLGPPPILQSRPGDSGAIYSAPDRRVRLACRAHQPRAYPSSLLTCLSVCPCPCPCLRPRPRLRLHRSRRCLRPNYALLLPPRQRPQCGALNPSSMDHQPLLVVFRLIRVSTLLSLRFNASRPSSSLAPQPMEAQADRRRTPNRRQSQVLSMMSKGWTCACAHSGGLQPPQAKPVSKV